MLMKELDKIHDFQKAKVSHLLPIIHLSSLLAPRRYMHRLLDAMGNAMCRSLLAFTRGDHIPFCLFLQADLLSLDL